MHARARKGLHPTGDSSEAPPEASGVLTGTMTQGLLGCCAELAAASLGAVVSAASGALASLLGEAGGGSGGASAVLQGGGEGRAHRARLAMEALSACLEALAVIRAAGLGTPDVPEKTLRAAEEVAMQAYVRITCQRLEDAGGRLRGATLASLPSAMVEARGQRGAADAREEIGLAAAGAQLLVSTAMLLSGGTQAVRWDDVLGRAYRRGCDALSAIGAASLPPDAAGLTRFGPLSALAHQVMQQAGTAPVLVCAVFCVAPGDALAWIPALSPPGGDLEALSALVQCLRQDRVSAALSAAADSAHLLCDPGDCLPLSLRPAARATLGDAAWADPNRASHRLPSDPRMSSRLLLAGLSTSWLASKCRGRVSEPPAAACVMDLALAPVLGCLSPASSRLPLPRDWTIRSPEETAATAVRRDDSITGESSVRLDQGRDDGWQRFCTALCCCVLFPLSDFPLPTP